MSLTDLAGALGASSKYQFSARTLWCFAHIARLGTEKGRKSRRRRYAVGICLVLKTSAANVRVILIPILVPQRVVFGAKFVQGVEKCVKCGGFVTEDTGEAAACKWNPDGGKVKCSSNPEIFLFPSMTIEIAHRMPL